MTTYVTYQCSICRRRKDIAQDNLRAQISQCTITKACSGTLYQIGESLTASQTPNVLGLTDWFPRGQKLNPTAVVQPPKFQTLSNSASGALTLGLFLTNVEANALQTIRLQLKQRLSADVPFTEYAFTQQISGQVVSGRDTTGKNLRFDSLAIAEERVQITVNGIVQIIGEDCVLTPNVITFTENLAEGTKIYVSVFGSAPTTIVEITLIKNSTSNSTTAGGAWANVRLLKSYDDGILPTDKKWWLFTANTVGNIATEAQYQLDRIIDANTDTDAVSSLSLARFFLSAPPYGNVDRHLNLFVDCQKLSEAFLLRSITGASTELTAALSVIEDVSPPFQLAGVGVGSANSFIAKNTFLTGQSGSDIVTNEPTSTRIIGPV